SDHAPFGTFMPLAVFTTTPDGGGIVQTIGPLKTLAGERPGASGAASRRFLIITELNDPSKVVLRQTASSNGRELEQREGVSSRTKAEGSAFLISKSQYRRVVKSMR